MIPTTFRLLRSLAVFVSAIVFFVTAVASRDLPEANLSIPVLVNLGDGSTGSGFYLTGKSNFFFVTARHVLLNEARHTLGGTNVSITYSLRSTNATFASYSNDTPEPKKVEFRVDLNALWRDNRVKFHQSNDVVVVNLGEAYKTAEGKMGNAISEVYAVRVDNTGGSMMTAELWSVKRFDDVLVGNEVYLFGYPSSIGIKQIPQLDYDRPLLRRGIVAGKNSKQRTIVLDSTVYPGNSGGPAWQVERDGLVTTYAPIGVVAEFVPFAEEWENKKFGYFNLNLSNSGYSIITPMDAVLELLSTWRETQ